MTSVVFIIGVLCGISIAWIWYVLAGWWADRPERVELDESWERLTGRRVP